jgi:hypothetical protein
VKCEYLSQSPKIVLQIVLEVVDECEDNTLTGLFSCKFEQLLEECCFASTRPAITSFL